MNRIVRKHKREEPIEGSENDLLFDRVFEPSSQGNRFKLLPWLAGGICIFAVLYGTSYLALFWLPPYEVVDMRSQLTADYGAWDFLIFQPIDPAIIEEIKQDQELPEQIIIDGSTWPTATATVMMRPTENDAPASASQATSENLLPSPTASGPTYTLSPIPTSVISLPEATVTPQPTREAKPTKSRKPLKTPKPRKTPKE